MQRTLNRKLCYVGKKTLTVMKRHILGVKSLALDLLASLDAKMSKSQGAGDKRRDIKTVECLFSR